MYKLLFSGIIFLLVSCGGPVQQENYAPPVFPRESEAHFQNIGDPVELYGSSYIAPYKDHLILVSRRDGTWLQIFDKHTGQRLGSFVPIGKGPGETVLITGFNINPATGLLILTDRSTRKILEYQLDSVIQNGKRTPEREYTLSDQTIVPSKIYYTKKGILVNGNGEQKALAKRLAIIENGQCIAQYNSYPSAADTTTLHKSYTDAPMAVSPDGTKLACGLIYGCILETFELSKDLDLKALRRFHKPEMESGASVAPTDNTIFGFADLCATDRYIYATYMGTNDINTMQGIAVFDWDGKEQHLYKTDRLLIDFCAEPDGSMLYGVAYNQESGEFQLVSMPLDA